MKTMRRRIVNIAVIAVTLAIGFAANCYAVPSEPSDGSIEEGALTVREYNYSNSSRIKLVPKYASVDASGIQRVCVGGLYPGAADGCVGLTLYRNATEALSSGTLEVDIFYDFNNDGRHTSDEKIDTFTTHISPDSYAVYDLEVARKAVKDYGTNSYKADLAAIEAYIYKNYPYGQTGVENLGFAGGAGAKRYDCITASYCVQTWSAYKYGINGRVYYTGAANHYEFESDDFWSFSYGGNSHPTKGDTPGSAKYNQILNALENNVQTFKSQGV